MDNETIQEIEDLRKDISYAVLESFQFQNERREKRHFIVELVLICLLVFSNAGWLIYESQMEKVTETSEITVTQDNDNGYNSFIGNDGEIVYGETNYKDKENKDLQTSQEKEVIADEE